MKYAIYLLVGTGVSIGLDALRVESGEQRLPYDERVFITLFWPVVVSAIAVMQTHELNVKVRE